MQENGGGGGEAELEAGEEGGSHRQTVQEVVSAISQEVEIPDYLLVAGISQLLVSLGVAELQHLLQQEEGDDPTQNGGSYSVMTVLLLVINYLKHRHNVCLSEL